MSADGQALRVLLAGESWTDYGIHVKGVNAYYSAGYEEGGAPLIGALEAGGCAVTYQPSHVALRSFPGTQAALSAFDVVVLSDIGSDTLALHPDTLQGVRRPDRLAVLADWTRAGGGLLMVGGYLSFSGYGGAARYAMTPLADVLPVRLLSTDDRVETPAGVVPVASGGSVPDLALPTEAWPHFLGYNRLLPRDEGVVLLEAAGDPFLAVRSVDAGRSAAFASDCSPHWAPPEAIEWTGYGPFWVSLVRWLARRS